MAVDLLGKALQVGGGVVHLPFTQLDLDRAPASIAQLHDHFHLDSVVVAVVQHLPSQGLAQHTQITDHQRFEHLPEPLQILQQSLRRSSGGRQRQRWIDEMTLRGLAQPCP